jgi:hypothetical protein
MPTLNLPWAGGTPLGSVPTWWRCGEAGEDAENCQSSVKRAPSSDFRAFRFSFALDLKLEIKQELLTKCFEYPIRKISRDRFYKN